MKELVGNDRGGLSVRLSAPNRIEKKIFWLEYGVIYSEAYWFPKCCRMGWITDTGLVCMAGYVEVNA